MTLLISKSQVQISDVTQFLLIRGVFLIFLIAFCKAAFVVFLLAFGKQSFVSVKGRHTSLSNSKSLKGTKNVIDF